MAPADTLVPRDGESLRDFMLRALDARGLSRAALARQLADRDDEDGKSWLRTLKRWTSPNKPQQSISASGAAKVAEALNADFGVFVRSTATTPDLLRQIVDRLERVEQRLDELQGTEVDTEPR